MLALAVSSLLAASTVSVKLDSGTQCPALATLTRQLERAGLTVVDGAADVQVGVTPSAKGVQVRGKRADGKQFERQLPAGEDCGAIERAIADLVHAWVNGRIPVISPLTSAPADAGTARTKP